MRCGRHCASRAEGRRRYAPGWTALRAGEWPLKRARRPAHPAISRLRRADLYCKPTARSDAVTVAEQSHTVTVAVALGARAFWPASRQNNAAAKRRPHLQPPASAGAELGFDDLGDAVAEVLDLLLVGALDHHPGERLGAAVAQQDAAGGSEFPFRGGDRVG